VSERWVALVEIPPEKRSLLEEILARIGALARNIQARPTRDRPPDLVLAPVEKFTRLGEIALGFNPAASPIPTALVAPAAVSPELLHLQLSHRFLNLIPEALWERPRCLERILRGLLFPNEAFDTRRFIGRPLLAERFPIGSLDEKHRVAREVIRLVGPHSAGEQQLRDIRLAINELINNAFFHPFRGPEGERKYSPRNFSRLERGDRVELELVVAEDAVAVAVEDNRGRLAPSEVLRYLLRQATGEGLYDSHGRGFYLVSHIVDHLCICLAPGEKARVVAVFHTDEAPPLRTLNFFVAHPSGKK